MNIKIGQLPLSMVWGNLLYIKTHIMKTHLRKIKNTVIISLLFTAFFILSQAYNGFAQNKSDNQDLAYEWDETTNEVAVAASILGNSFAAA